MRILIVDDSPEDRTLYRRLLGRSGRSFSIEEVDAADRAVEAIESEDFDCVLLDYNLPDGTGIGVLEEVVGEGATPCNAFVMLTGQGNEEIAVAAMKRGVQDYLVKGEVTAEPLLRAIDSAVERVALRRELDQHRLDLLRSNRELERFASVVAHDLKNPLASVYAVLQSIRDDVAALGADRADLVVSGLAACERMDTLITELLAFSRIGSRARRDDEVDLAAVVEDVRSDLRSLIEAEEATVEVDELPDVRGDRGQLSRLFQNLVVNSIRYRRDEPPHVRITSDANDGAWTIRVADNGQGIATERQADVFEAFCRLHRQDDVPGTGLGLAICKRVVEEHGGVIGLDSTPGEGTTVWFTLPR